jgi:hypothetical protein
MILGATITGSLILNGVNLSSITGSEASINALNSFTASAATTGSNVFKSNQTVTGSVDITGSLTVVGPITGTVTTASYVLNAVSASYALNATTASYALVSTSASYAANSDLLDDRDSLTFANTGSNAFVGTQNINGSVAITGSLTTTGAITAQTLNVQQVTSSIVYSSGSNVFGNSVSNTQSMTGSVGISGSLEVVGAGTVTGILTLNSTITNGTYTYTLPSATGTLALTSALSGYLPLTGGTLTGIIGVGMTPIAANGAIQLSTNTGIAPQIYYTKGTTAAYFGVDAFGTDVFGGGTSGAYPFIFVTNSTERMRITSGGDIQYKGSSTTTNAQAYIENTNTDLTFYASSSGSVSKNMRFFYNGGTGEAMRITSAGYLLIGQTTASGGSNGIYFRPGIESGFIVTSDVALQLSRLVTTGDIQTFYSGTTRVGKIAVGSSTVTFESATNGGLTIASTGAATFSSSIAVLATGITVTIDDAGKAGYTITNSAAVRTYKMIAGIDGTSNTGFSIRNVTAGRNELLFTDGGAATFSSSITATSATFSGVITSTMGNNTLIFNAVSATTGYQYMSFKNTSGHLLIGVEGSTTGQLQTNDGAYSTVITTATATKLSLGTNQVERLGFDGTTGAATFSSSITLSGAITNFGTGTGTYTRSVWYNDTSNQILFENARATDDVSGTGRTVYFTWRGGPGVGGGVQLQHGANAWAAYTSDARMKTKVADVENGLSAIMQLEPIKFKWSRELENSRTVTGFTAQNVEQAIPDAVFNSWKDEKLGDVKSYYQDYLIPYLVKAIQELNAKITELENK